MRKIRISIPKRVSEKVLKEFNHRCAKCGADNPQLHHIDENPSNNDPVNLIPLCPNCHLIDQHNPTKSIEPEKLRLFRIYKDPTILKPQFHPLFLRLQFLDEVDVPVERLEALENKALELVEFIFTCEKGEFYGRAIAPLIIPRDVIVNNTTVTRFRSEAEKIKRTEAYLLNLHQVKEQVLSLVVEMLRFQSW